MPSTRAVIGVLGDPSAAILVVCVVAVLLVPTTVAGILPDGVPIVTGVPWVAWRTEVIDEGDVAIREEPGLALAPGDIPHVIYNEYASSVGPLQVRYGWKAGLSWQSLALESQALGGDIAFHDATVTAHLTWEGNMDRLQYATVQAGIVGTIVTVDDPPGKTVDSPEILLDGSGLPHILYDVSNEVRHAWKDSSGIWHVETIDSSYGGVAGDLDSSGRLHVVYLRHGTGNHFRYAIRSLSGTWSYESVTGCDDALGFALDAADTPHVSCRDPGQGLVYRTRVGSTWQKEFVDAGALWATSLAVNANGVVHIAYEESFNPFFPDDPTRPSHLFYAARSGGQWILETADRVGSGTGFSPTIKIDSEGRPVIVYILAWWHRQTSENALNHKHDVMLARPAASLLPSP